MKNLFTLKPLFVFFVLLTPFVGMSQVATVGDYRSLASGNWNTAASWQVRDAGGNWTTATALPTITNNVYIQNGHTITLDATVVAVDGLALDLHIDAAGVLAMPAAYNVKVAGKIRCFTSTAAETSAADGTYLGTSSTAPVSTMITTTSTGVLKFIGSTRTITNTGEWNSSGINCAAEFALDANATGTLTVGCKFKNIVFSGGIVTTTAFISGAAGDISIRNGSRVISSRSGIGVSGTGNAVFASSSSTKCGIVTIDLGGILELTGSTPSIDCTTFTNNGTVIYSKGGGQTLLQKTGGDASSTALFNTYSTLILATSNSKTLISSITVSNLLQFTGTATIVPTSAITLTMLNGSTIDRSVISGSSIPSTASAVFFGQLSTDLINVSIGASINNSNELPSAPSPGKIGTLTINSGVIYQITSGRTVTNIVNNGQINLAPGTSMTLVVGGTLAGTGILSTKLNTTSPFYYSASLSFTSTAAIGTLYMKQATDSNHLKNLSVAGGLILGYPVLVDTSLTLTSGVLTNGSNLTLGTNIKLTRAAGSLSAAPTFGTSLFNLQYTDVVATTTGFEMPTSASVLRSLTINNAAGVTLSSSAVVNDTLKMLLGNLTIAPAQTLMIASGLDVQGAPFSSSKYIISGISGANTGALRINNFTTAKLFPIGTAAYYLPVTATPTAAMDYSASVFTGATSNGLPTGTALTAAQKDRLVNAVWTINRLAGTGNCTIQTNWDASLEGAAFSTFANAGIGIARHDGTSWGTFTGTGDNTANTATATFANFSPFLVGEYLTVLPVTLKTVSATIKATGIDINWKVENESSILKYEIEKSKNGIDFNTVGSVTAANKSSYIFTDPATLSGVNYYRIKMINTNGGFSYSYIITVKEHGIADVNLYPNPVANALIINGLKNNATIKIVNTVGQIVLQQNTNANTLSVDVSGLKMGVYAIIISAENEKQISKTFIKQ